MAIFWFKVPTKGFVEGWTEAKSLEDAKESLLKGYWEVGEELSTHYDVKGAEFMCEEPDGEIEE